MSTLPELQEANKKLESLNTLRSDMISLSGHDLRTSLGAIKWMFKMLLDNDLGPLTAEQEQVIKKGYQSNDRMISLVNDLLAFNHTNDATVIYEPIEIDMVLFVEDIILDFQGEAFKRGVEMLFLKPEEKIETVYIDPKPIRIVMQNLLDNALKYTDKNGNVFISLFKNNHGQVSVSVRDTGIGIPEKEQGNIFSKFYRATNAQEKDVVGSGLGLYIIKRILEQAGGELAFTSKQGEGSTFTVTLPLKK